MIISHVRVNHTLNKIICYASIIAGVILSGCSSTSYNLIPDSNYSQSMLDFKNASKIEYIQKSYFEVKLISVYILEKNDMRFYFYDLLIAPRTTEEIDIISILLEPDYQVNPLLGKYFSKENNLLWQTYSVKPKSAVFNSLWNINYKELYPNDFGAIKVQSFLCDGGDESLLNAGLSEEVLRVSLQQLVVTVKTAFAKEVFYFNARDHLNEISIDQASHLDHLPIKGLLENKLTVKYSKFIAEGE